MKNHLLSKISITLAYIGVIFVNYLANALPIGGVTTGEASDSFANLFTPAGVTFSIWGLIYLLLLGYVLYSWGLFDKKRSVKKKELIFKTDKIFIVNALANISWIFAWHYGFIALSVVIMLVLLVTLILLADILNKEKFTFLEKSFLRLPFSVYFGWITVATIANITVLLVSINWNGWGISEQIWTIIILLVGMLIGIVRALKDKNIPYISVLIWAYAGILLKHMSENGFSGQYPNIILTLIISMVVFGATVVWLGFGNKKKF